jgi:hypothetical protein
MKPGDLVRIISRDGECIGHGLYVRDEGYPVIEKTCALIFYNESGRWVFGHFDEPWWRMEVIDEDR